MLIRSSLSVHLLLSLLWYTAVFCTNYPANTSDEIGNLTKILKSAIIEPNQPQHVLTGNLFNITCQSECGIDHSFYIIYNNMEIQWKDIDKEVWKYDDELKADLHVSKSPLQTVDCNDIGTYDGPVISTMSVRANSSGVYYITCAVQARFTSTPFLVYSRTATVHVQDDEQDQSTVLQSLPSISESRVERQCRTALPMTACDCTNDIVAGVTTPPSSGINTLSIQNTNTATSTVIITSSLQSLSTVTSSIHTTVLTTSITSSPSDIATGALFTVNRNVAISTGVIVIIIIVILIITIISLVMYCSVIKPTRTTSLSKNNKRSHQERIDSTNPALVFENTSSLNDRTKPV